MTKNMLAAAPIEQKMQYLEAATREALDAIGAHSLVGVLALNEDVRISFRMPGCPPDCADEKKCTANIFHNAAHDLLDNAEALAEGRSALIDNGEKKPV